MPGLEPGLRAWSSFRDYAYDDPGRVKLNHWHVAALKRIAMRKRELPALAKSAGAGHPPVLWRTHETWRRPGHPTYSLKDAIAELPRPCKRRKSRATSRVVADLQCVSNAGPPGLVIMPVTPTRERR